MNSLTQAGKDKVCLWSDHFILNGRESGILLLKVIIQESHLNSNITMNSIRTQLSNLDEYITTIGCNIIKFNEHVKCLIEQLNAHGGETQDLLANLFKAYVSVKDAHFVDYVNEKFSQYEEGELMEADQLMTLTANKCKNMMIQNQWEVPSPHDTTIQALESKVEKLQQELKCAPKQQQQKNPNKKKEDQSTKPQHPKWLTNNEKPQRDNFPLSECGMGTNGTGVPRKLEENVRDDGSITLMRVAKGRHSEVSIRNGHERMHRNKRKPNRRARGKKKPVMGKNESIIVLRRFCHYFQ